MKTTTPTPRHTTDLSVHPGLAAYVRAAHARQAPAPRREGSRGTFRKILASLGGRDVGMTVPYRDAVR